MSELTAALAFIREEREHEREHPGMDLDLARLDAADRAYARKLYEEACARAGVEPVPVDWKPGK